MRRILITGGGRGIGAAAVCKFTSLGDKVAFVYRSDDAKAKALSEKQPIRGQTWTDGSSRCILISPARTRLQR